MVYAINKYVYISHKFKGVIHRNSHFKSMEKKTCLQTKLTSLELLLVFWNTLHDYQKTVKSLETKNHVFNITLDKWNEQKTDVIGKPHITFALNFFPWHLSRFMAIKIFNIEIPEIRVQASATAINELDATNDLI